MEQNTKRKLALDELSSSVPSDSTLSTHPWVHELFYSVFTLFRQSHECTFMIFWASTTLSAVPFKSCGLLRDHQLMQFGVLVHNFEMQLCLDNTKMVHIIHRIESQRNNWNTKERQCFAKIPLLSTTKHGISFKTRTILLMKCLLTPRQGENFSRAAGTLQKYLHELNNHDQRKKSLNRQKNTSFVDLGDGQFSERCDVDGSFFQQRCHTDYFLGKLNIAIVAIIFLDHRERLFFDYFAHF